MKVRITSSVVIVTLGLVTALSSGAADKPNILVIWGDDIGLTNISHNSRGVMGYRTPNIDRIAAAGTPWFVWWNGTRMHFRTHVKPELRGISGQDEYSDGTVEHDMHVGRFLGTVKKYPPRQKAASFSLDQVMNKLTAPAGAH
jgi:hypothetical protein